MSGKYLPQRVGGGVEEVKRFTTEEAQRERSCGRHEAKPPGSLRELTQVRQDDDVYRNVRDAAVALAVH
jgi:hypothetical protein